MNLLDKLIGVFSPQAGLNRVRSRTALNLMTRKYEAAQNAGRRNSGWYRPRTTAAEEVSAAANRLADAAQELCRNSPLAHRIKMIWASNIIGIGIQAQITCTNNTKRRKITAAWEQWANSTFSDFDGHYSFYGLQWLWAATIVESGGVLIRLHVDLDEAKELNNGMIPLRLQTIEQTMLDANVTTPKVAGNKVRSGIEFTSTGGVYGYWIKNINPETGREDAGKSVFLRKDLECIHLYRKERANQHLGVSWLTQSATTLQKYDTLIDAKLMQDQIAACLGLVVEGASKSIGLGDKHSQIEEIEPGMVHYVDEGSKIHTIIPPSSQGSQQFMDTIRADIAIGAGLAQTQLTGDYSKLNFASGRMGKIEFFQTLEYCQTQMMATGLNMVHNWFKRLYLLKSGNNMKDDFSVSWTYPPRAVVQPKEELDVLVSKVRNGWESPSGAAKAFGKDLETVISQWNADKATFGDLPFDIDPSKYSRAGNQLNDDDAASSNSSVSGDNDNKGDDL